MEFTFRESILKPFQKFSPICASSLPKVDKSAKYHENKPFSLPPKPQALQNCHKQWKYCYYQSSNIKIPPQNQHSTKQGGRQPAPGSRTSLLPNRKAQLPFSISGTRQTPGRELLRSTRSLLSCAAKHISHRPTGAEPLCPPHQGSAAPTRGLQAASVAPARAVVTATH